MRSVLIVALIFLSACVSEPLPDGFKKSGDFDPVAAAKNRISLGLTYLQNGNYSQAKFNLDKALQFAPRLADAHYSMAYYYQQVDEFSLADDAYQKAMDFAPKNADIANSYGAFLCQNGQYDKAKEFFLKAVNSSNYISTAETFENLALCSQSQGHTEDALEYLQNALNHQPSRAKALMLMVQLQMRQKQWSEARKNLRRYEKLARVSPDTLWMSIEIERALNNSKLAQGYGDMLVRMYPTHPRTIEYIKNRDNLTTNSPAQKQVKKLKPSAPLIVVAPTSEDAAVSSNDPSKTSDLVVVALPDERLNDDERQPNDEQASASVAKAQQKSSQPTQQDALVDSQRDDAQQDDTVANRDNNPMDDQPKDSDSAMSETVNAEQREAPHTEPVASYHQVQKGENLYRISLRYNVKMQRLVEWNELASTTAIYPGMQLLVVDPTTVDKQ